MASLDFDERELDVSQLGNRLASLRLCDASALETVRRSLARHGQLSALSVFADGERLEIIDGFKRVHAARTLGWPTLRASVARVGVVEAKMMLLSLHERRGLTELEEGWLIRSLYRDDSLSQPAIARRLGRHKSWVCRRLMLVSALDPAVQGDVRLGVLSARAAVVVSRLPRGNQHAAAGLVIRRGLTVRQTELVVAELLECADDAARAQKIAQWLTSIVPGSRASIPLPRRARTEADGLAADITTLRQTAARLSARLLGTPLTALGPEVAVLMRESLVTLRPVLSALQETLAKACTEKDTSEKDAA